MSVLTDKYRIHEVEAKLLSNFLRRMLQWQPKNRSSARNLLQDPWLKVGSLSSNTHMSKQYFNEWRKATRGVNPTTSESEEEGESDSSEKDESSEDEKDEVIV